RVPTERGTARLASFPIGIDTKVFAERAARWGNRGEVARLRGSLLGARLVIGVDRVDYSKGLDNRFRAFDRMLEMQPALKRTVRLLQIAVPSRCQIPAYKQLSSDLASLVGEINGRHAEVDWTPIRYLNKGFAQSALPMDLHDGGAGSLLARRLVYELRHGPRSLSARWAKGREFKSCIAVISAPADRRSSAVGPLSRHLSRARPASF